MRVCIYVCMYLWPGSFNNTRSSCFISSSLLYGYIYCVLRVLASARESIIECGYALKYLEKNPLFAVPVGYTLPASRTHGYVNSHIAALTCLHVTVLCCVVCYKKLFKICFRFFVHCLSITYLISFALSTMYCVVKGTNLLVKLIITVLLQLFQVFSKVCVDAIQCF